MKKLFLLISVFTLSLATFATTPELSKTTPVTLMSADATLSSNGSVVNDSITWTPGTIHEGYAKWRVNIVDTLAYQATLDMRSTNGFRFRVSVINPVSGDTVAKTTSISTSNKVYTDFDCGTFRMFGIEPGEYDIAITDTVQWSAAKVASLTLKYAGGEILTTSSEDELPCTAAFVSGGMVKLANGDVKSSGASDLSSEYAAWRVNITKSGRYIVSFNGDSNASMGHQFSVGLHTSLNGASSDVVSEPAKSWTAGEITFPDTLDVANAGFYYLKLTNSCANSSKSISALTIRYIGGDKIDIPNTLRPADALISPDWTKTDSKISHAESKATTGWAKWNVNVPKDGSYNVTINISCDNGHLAQIKVFETGASSATYTLDETSATKWDTGSQSINLGDVTLSKRGYVIQAANTVEHSHMEIVSVAISYNGGATVDVPGHFFGADALLNSTKLTRLENGDIKYNDNGTPTNEYVYWKVNAKAGTYDVILNIPEESTSGHVFKVELYSDLASSKIDDAYETAESYGTGLITLAQTITVESDGDYYIKVVNDRKYSKSTLRSISIAPSITIDEAEDNIESVIEPNDGKVVNAELTRSFVAGMYNTICLPFAVSAAEMGRVFPGAVVKELSSSSIEEGGFVLNLNFSSVSEIAAGVPYLIQPAEDIDNPKFIGVTIDKTLRPTNTSKANFVGNFVKGTIDADENNLFLGAENTLYFPTAVIDIKGMRGYFVIHDAAAHMIKRARIVENEQTQTDIELVKSQEPTVNNQKLLINGQLIIVRDGVRYNVMGARVQ